MHYFFGASFYVLCYDISSFVSLWPLTIRSVSRNSPERKEVYKFLLQNQLRACARHPESARNDTVSNNQTKKCFSRRPRDVWLFPDFNFQKVLKRIPNFTFLFQILLSPIRNKTELKCSPAVDSASSVDSVFRFRIRFSDSKQYCILHHAIAPYNSILIQNHNKKNNNCYL